MMHLFPVVTVLYVIWLTFLGYRGLSLLGLDGVLPSSFLALVPTLNAIAVIWVLPNVIRQACLQVLSSTMHYQG